MNLKEMIENRIEGNNVLIKELEENNNVLIEELEEKNDEMKIKIMFNYYYCFIGYAGNRGEIKARREENEFLKELLVKITINTTTDGKCVLL